ncbi:hypothetical protein R6Q57_016612 [Mikania cordata]
MGAEIPEYTYTTDDRNMFAVRNDRSNVCCWINKDDTDDIDMTLDPMNLLKFGKEDMMKLHQSPIRVYSGNDEEAKPFTRIVAYAIEMKLYAGAGPHSVTLPIG